MNESTQGAPFPDTRWSRIMAAREKDVRPLDELLRQYWKPVYATARRAHGLAVEDAKDATQEFFATMLDRDFLRTLSVEGGRFRGFLKTALANFLHDRHRLQTAAKRGGGRIAVDLAEIEPLLADGAPPPDRIFDLEWRRSVLEAASVALKERLRQQGKEVYHSIFELVENGSAATSYKEAAARFSLTEDHVRNYLHYARKAFRQAVLDVLRDSVSSEGDLDTEVRELFDA